MEHLTAKFANMTTEESPSPAEVALARELARMRIKLDIAEGVEPSLVNKLHDDLDIPIKQIDGVSVNAKFHMTNAKGVEKKVCIVIENSNCEVIEGNLFQRWYPFTKETAQDDTMLLLEVIKGLSFDKSKAMFKINCTCCKKNPEEMNPELWHGLFQDCEKIQVKWDTCCVCHEITNTKFSDCGHTICMVCVEKLETEYKDDDESERHMKCPYCRQPNIVEGRGETCLLSHF